jgi:uncharacterized protein (DUF1697 family)
MEMYVAMLRGINVGGKRPVDMAELRSAFARLGHADVLTYIRTGNVIFRSHSNDPGRLAAEAERLIERDLGLSVSVLLRTASELAAVREGNPYVQAGIDERLLHVTFLGRDPDPDLLAALGEGFAGEDDFEVGERAVYLHCPGGYGATKLTNAHWERRLRVPATTRNWKTVGRLCELAGGGSAA